MITEKLKLEIMRGYGSWLLDTGGRSLDSALMSFDENGSFVEFRFRHGHFSASHKIAFSRITSRGELQLADLHAWLSDILMALACVKQGVPMRDRPIGAQLVSHAGPENCKE
jgi:hypothetical protein